MAVRAKWHDWPELGRAIERISGAIGRTVGQDSLSRHAWNQWTGGRECLPHHRRPIRRDWLVKSNLGAIMIVKGSNPVHNLAQGLSTLAHIRCHLPHPVCGSHNERSTVKG